MCQLQGDGLIRDEVSRGAHADDWGSQLPLLPHLLEEAVDGIIYGSLGDVGSVIFHSPRRFPDTRSQSSKLLLVVSRVSLHLFVGLGLRRQGSPAAHLLVEASLQSALLFHLTPLQLVRRLVAKASGCDTEPLLHHQRLQDVLPPLDLPGMEVALLLHASDVALQCHDLLLEDLDLPLVLSSLSDFHRILLLLLHESLDLVPPLVDGHVPVEQVAVFLQLRHLASLKLVLIHQRLQLRSLGRDLLRSMGNGLLKPRQLLVLLSELHLGGCQSLL